MASQAVATVTVGTVTPTDSNANYVEQNNSTVFVDYMINNRYEKDGHKYMMPVSSPTAFQGTSVSIVQLASSTLLWIADWTVAKWGVQPESPDPTSQDPNWILLDEIWEPAMITVGADGDTPLYRLSGTFVYAHLNPSPNTVNNIVFPRPPWLLDVYNRSMPISQLQQGLIGNSLQNSSKLDRFVGGS